MLVLPSADRFQSTPALTSFYRMLSTNVDRRGRAFVSTMEGVTNPVYAVQWHPERPAYEWTPDMGIPHDMAAVRANQWMAQFLGSEVRKNAHTFTNATMEALFSIYSYVPIDPSASSAQFYVFPSFSTQS